jgi:hypothetical protein
MQQHHNLRLIKPSHNLSPIKPSLNLLIKLNHSHSLFNQNHSQNLSLLLSLLLKINQINQNGTLQFLQAIGILICNPSTNNN